MRVVVDATAAVRQGAGVGRFARGILRGLALCDAQNEYVLLTTGKARLDLGTLQTPARVRWLQLPVPERAARIAWQRLRLAPSPALLAGKASLFFTPDFALPPLGRVPGILTVHDLSFLLLPECADQGLRRYLGEAVPRSARHAAGVIAVSQTTAAALTNLLGVPPERIGVVPNGVDPQFTPAGVDEQESLAGLLAARFGLEPGYLLTVGTIEPRKNLVRLLQAYHGLRRTWPALDGGQAGRSRPIPPLVIAGREGWLFEPVFREVARLGLGRAVRFLTRVPDSDLVLLYRGSGAFVYPSLYEGFGIPPLEAMACGIPVAASTGGALPEILGDAALSFDPLDITSIYEAMRRVLLDAPLREELIRLGKARAAQYTWERAGLAALEMFERVAA
jgi:glycosyltransferase involved in cell wall biosynthesis